MKLLIITQAVDTEDPVLGFFVRWIDELSKRFEQTEVICLKEGDHLLSKNVHVHSLGKEFGTASKGVYTWRFLVLVWKLHNEYDAIFVHMNQEYILIAGWLWKLLGKRVYMWRNHYAGSWLTDITAFFCTKIFCTSTHSFTAKYKKTVFMPVGVDTSRFFLDEHIQRIPHSILFLSRISPSKRPEMLIDALALFAQENIAFSADFYGSPLQKDEAYCESLKEKVHLLNITNRVSFYPGVPNSQTPDIYRAHDIFVNTSPSGMLDKTIFEAAASGCLILAASADIATKVGENFHFDSSVELAACIERHFTNAMSTTKLLALARDNSLSTLGDRLAEEMQMSTTV